MELKVNTAERVLARLAGAAHGIVTRQELLAAGLTPMEIRGRVAKGLLIPEYRGVYRVGHGAPSREASYMAATKAGPSDALLGGRAAAHAWRLVKGPTPPAEIVASTLCRVPGLRSRRCRGLSPQDGTTWMGIPITTVPRTLVDLASILPISALARVCHEAGILHGTTPRQIEAVLARRPNSPSGAKLRAIMRGDELVTLSKLEAKFLARLRKAGFPLPVTNKPAGSKRVDCRWPAHHLTVELDSYRFHNSRHSWEQGYRREREARARGDEFRRYTYADIVEDPRLMLAELRDLLSEG